MKDQKNLWLKYEVKQGFVPSPFLLTNEIDEAVKEAKRRTRKINLAI